MHVNSSNISVEPKIERSNEENIAASLIIAIIASVSFAGNGLVLLSYVFCSKLRSNPSNWLIFNLALSDALSTIYVQMPSIVSLADPQWHLMNGACAAHAVITWIIMTASNWIVATISADRAMAVNKPFQYRNSVTLFRARMAMLCTWIFSLIVSASLVNTTSVSFNSWELMCTPQWTQDNLTDAYFAAVLCFYVPALIILFSNISVIYAVRRLTSVVTSSLPTETGQSSFSAQDSTKTLRSLYVLVAVYFVLSSPYFFTKFDFRGDQQSLLPKSMLVLTIILMFLASAINPFIYAILRRDLREGMMQYLKRLKNCTSNLMQRHRTAITSIISPQQA